MRSETGAELVALIGEAAFVRLAEAFGGSRVYVPAEPSPEHRITKAIGARATMLLARRYAPDVIRVPVARERRATLYRASGLSNAAVARKLGMTESGVEKMFMRHRASAPAE